MAKKVENGEWNAEPADSAIYASFCLHCTAPSLTLFGSSICFLAHRYVLMEYEKSSYFYTAQFALPNISLDYLSSPGSQEDNWDGIQPTWKLGLWHLFSVCSNDHTACTRSFERYPPVVTSLHQEVLRLLLQFHVAPQSGLLKTRTPKSCCTSLPGASKGLDGIPFKYTIPVTWFVWSLLNPRITLLPYLMLPNADWELGLIIVILPGDVIEWGFQKPALPCDLLASHCPRLCSFIQPGAPSSPWCIVQARKPWMQEC